MSFRYLGEKHSSLKIDPKIHCNKTVLYNKYRFNLYFSFDLSHGLADLKNDPTEKITRIKVFETGKSPNGTNNYTQMIGNDCETAL